MTKDEDRKRSDDAPRKESWIDLETGEEVHLDEADIPVAQVQEPSRVYPRRVPPAWKIALLAAGLGLLLALLIYFFPDLSTFTGPGGATYQTAYVLLVIPVLAALWAIAGLVGRGPDVNRQSSILALIIAVFSAGLLLVDLRAEPVAEVDATPVYERDGMSPQELREWRGQRLYRGAPAEPADNQNP